MRIVLLNQYYAPDEAATAQLLSDVGAELARRGHDVVAIMGNRGYGDPSRRYRSREMIDGVEIRRIRTTSFGRGSGLGRGIDYLTFVAGAAWKLMTMHRTDVIVALTTPPMVGLLAGIVGKLRRTRFVLWSMDVYPDVAYELGAIRERSLAGRIVKRLAERTHAMSDTVVALGDTMRERLLERGARNVEVIHNWADGGAIRPRPVEGHPLRAEWAWGDEMVVLYSGNMGLAHEFDTALEGMRRGLEGVRLAFVGGGPRRGEIVAGIGERGSGSGDQGAEIGERGSGELPLTPALSPDLGLSPGGDEQRGEREKLAVEVRDYMGREMLPLSLTAGDVHLVTLRDGVAGLLVPSKIYGILAAGRPTIYVGPNRGEIFEILSEGRCGIRVAIGDVEGFRAAAEAYRDDPERRATEGCRARELFERKYAKEIALEKWISVCEMKNEN